MGDKGVMQMDEEDEDDADAAITLNPITVYFGTESTSTGPLE
ncbi:uncharacterized protein RSE6_16136 [Rhynchosporium secalis]|uniref:Uncharacterized protein n=1 Tax=Rhynchosporium secalis TaxID=38038 RepID=A0A1E1MUM3_RHYSE|nr:uncharacterized protein RSE6_16136 [Rhynchosporium secalis]